MGREITLEYGDQEGGILGRKARFVLGDVEGVGVEIFLALCGL